MVKETIESLTEKARQAMARGDYPQARGFYHQILAAKNDHPDAHYGLATACFLLNDLASSVFHFKEVTRLDPLRAGAYINLGAIFNRLDQLDDAIPMLRRGIQLDKSRAEGFYNLGLVYRRRGQMELAQQAYRDATRINPRMADAHFNLANIYLELGELEEAAQHYRKTLEVRPNWEKAVRGLEQAERLLVEQSAQDAPDTSLLNNTISEKPLPNLDRLVDPEVHGNLLNVLHQTTLEMETQGRVLLTALQAEMEPLLKELSQMLLGSGSSSGVNQTLQKLEKILANFQSLQKSLDHKVQNLGKVSEQMIRI